MSITETFCARVWILLLLMQVNFLSYSQDPLTQYDEWSKRLSAVDDHQNIAYEELYILLNDADSTKAFTFLNEIERRTIRPNSHFKARINCLKCWKQYVHHRYQSLSELMLITQQALKDAYESEDEYLISSISFKCGTLMVAFKELETGATFLIQGQEIADRLGGQLKKERYMNYIILGEVLFHCREYEKSIFYTKKVLELYDDTVSKADYFKARFNNTVGQNYMKLKEFDSAMVYFTISQELARKAKDEIWIALNSGYMGEVLFYERQFDKAKPYLEYNYSVNRTHEYDHAARSLQWLARIDLEHGHTDSALIKVKEAMQLLMKTGYGYYLQPNYFLELVYLTTADVYRARGNTDSFYHYNRLYANLHDSLQEVTLLSGTKISKLRINNENNFRAIQLLQKERRTRELIRNFTIIAIILVSIILFLYLNRLRLKEMHREQFALQQKNAAETELNSARQQLQQFTENIIEKNNLIERLKLELAHKEMNAEQHRLMEELSHQTILTEKDWDNFKHLFEKIYPGFFIKLRERSRDITLAELRMAALTRLNLTTREMASMLGISVDSVQKTRQRLRQRLHIPAEENLEETVSSL